MVRDDKGNFLGAFTKKLGAIGQSQILEVELRDIFKGLKYIEEKGIKKTYVVCDSSITVNLVKKVDPIVQQIKQLNTPDFSLTMEKIKGDTNLAAHLLAQEVVVSKIDYQEFDKPPTTKIKMFLTRTAMVMSVASKGQGRRREGIWEKEGLVVQGLDEEISIFLFKLSC